MFGNRDCFGFFVRLLPLVNGLLQSVGCILSCRCVTEVEGQLTRFTQISFRAASEQQMHQPIDLLLQQLLLLFLPTDGFRLLRQQNILFAHCELLMTELLMHCLRLLTPGRLLSQLQCLVLKPASQLLNCLRRLLQRDGTLLQFHSQRRSLRIERGTFGSQSGVLFLKFLQLIHGAGG